MKNILLFFSLVIFLISCSKDDKYYTHKYAGSWVVKSVTHYRLDSENKFVETENFDPEGYFILWDNNTIYKENNLGYHFKGKIPYCVMEVTHDHSPDSTGAFNWYADDKTRMEFNYFNGNAQSFYAVFYVDRKGKNELELTFHCNTDSLGNYSLSSSAYWGTPNSKEVMVLKRKRK